MAGVRGCETVNKKLFGIVAEVLSAALARDSIQAMTAMQAMT